MRLALNRCFGSNRDLPLNVHTTNSSSLRPSGSTDNRSNEPALNLLGVTRQVVWSSDSRRGRGDPRRLCRAGFAPPCWSIRSPHTSSPSDQSTLLGTPVDLRLTSAGGVGRITRTYNGLSPAVDVTGHITGSPASSGTATHLVTAIATDADYATRSVSFIRITFGHARSTALEIPVRSSWQMAASPVRYPAPPAIADRRRIGAYP
jgi:hypothetical protein